MAIRTWIGLARVPGRLVLLSRRSEPAKHHDQLLPVWLHAEPFKHSALCRRHQFKITLNALQQLSGMANAGRGRTQRVVKLIDLNIIELEDRLFLLADRLFGHRDVYIWIAIAI